VAPRSAISLPRSSLAALRHFIATALFATFGSSFPIALYFLGCGVIGLVSVSLLTDYTNKDVSQEYQGV